MCLTEPQRHMLPRSRADWLLATHISSTLPPCRRLVQGQPAWEQSRRGGRLVGHGGWRLCSSARGDGSRFGTRRRRVAEGIGGLVYWRTLRVQPLLRLSVEASDAERRPGGVAGTSSPVKRTPSCLSPSSSFQPFHFLPTPPRPPPGLEMRLRNTASILPAAAEASVGRPLS